MANEVWHNYETGNTLYFCAFQADGNVFLTGGASDEVWGTGGRTAADYDEAMVEDGAGGHYVGTFDTSIAVGVYRVCVYLQAGANPANTDIPIAQGEIYWDGTAEISITTLDASIEEAIDDIETVDAIVGSILIDTGTTIPAQLDDIESQQSVPTVDYTEGGGGSPPVVDYTVKT